MAKSKYTKDFIAARVAEAIRDENIKGTADKYGIPHTSMYAWIKQHKAKQKAKTPEVFVSKRPGPTSYNDNTHTRLRIEIEEKDKQISILKEMLAKATELLLGKL